MWDQRECEIKIKKLKGEEEKEKITDLGYICSIIIRCPNFFAESRIIENKKKRFSLIAQMSFFVKVLLTRDVN